MRIAPHKLKDAIWLLSILMYASALACPTFCTNVECDGIGAGTTDLLLGWTGLFGGGSVYLAWLANPFFLAAVLTNKKSPSVSLIMSLFTLIAGLSFLRGGEVILNEAGHKAFITGFQIGYWLWLTSFVMMTVAAVLSIRLKSPRIQHHIDE